VAASTDDSIMLPGGDDADEQAEDNHTKVTTEALAEEAELDGDGDDDDDGDGGDGGDDGGGDDGDDGGDGGDGGDDDGGGDDGDDGDDDDEFELSEDDFIQDDDDDDVVVLSEDEIDQASRDLEAVNVKDAVQAGMASIHEQLATLESSVIGAVGFYERDRDALKTSLGAARANLSVATDDIEALRKRRDELEDQLTDERLAHSDTRKALEITTETRNKASEEVLSLGKQLNAVQKELAEVLGDRGELEKRMDSSAHKLAEEKQKSKKTTAELAAIREEHEDELSAHAQDVAELNEKVRDLEAKLEHMIEEKDGEIDTRDKALELRQTEFSELYERNIAQRIAIADLQEALAQAPDVSELKAELAEREALLGKMMATVGAFGSQVSQLTGRVAAPPPIPPQAAQAQLEEVEPQAEVDGGGRLSPDAELQAAISDADKAVADAPATPRRKRKPSPRHDAARQLLKKADTEASRRLAAMLSETPRFDSHAALHNLSLSSKGAYLLSRMDGTVSFGDLMDSSGLPRGEAAEILLDLVEKNVI